MIIYGTFKKKQGYSCYNSCSVYLYLITKGAGEDEKKRFIVGKYFNVFQFFDSSMWEF